MGWGYLMAGKPTLLTLICSINSRLFLQSLLFLGDLMVVNPVRM